MYAFILLIMNKLKDFFKHFYIEIFVFLFFIVIHLPGLGHEIFNTDVLRWKARTYDFGEGVFTLNFEETIQKYHPGVTLMWIGTAAVKFYNLYYDLAFSHPPINNDVSTVFELHFVQKLCVVVFISLILASIVYVLRKNFGKRLALISGLLISVEPFYYALTRVFHLEGLLSTLMIASFVWFYFYLQEKRPFRLILSAFFGSLAVLTKTSALYLIPFMALLVLLEAIFSYDFSHFSLKTALNKLKPGFFSFITWLLLAYLGFYVLWPAMWISPAQALSTIYRGIFTIGLEEGHEQIYFGRFTQDPGALYYVVVLALRSSVFLLAGLLGSVISLRNGNKKERLFILYSFLFALFYAIQITIPTKKLDRYILPSILALGLISSFSYAHIITVLGKKLGILLLAFVMGLGLFRIYELNLDYFSYYNPLFGGLQKGIYVLEPKWIIGQHEIQSYFKPKCSQDEDGLILALPEKYFTQAQYFIEEIGCRPVIKDLTPFAQDADYFVYPVWEDDSAKENRFPLEYIEAIKLRGVPVWNVYKRIPQP